MRLWSIHPKYLDNIGLVALWRESLLARKVLEGNTKGYKNHSQLIRFKNSPQPLKMINKYLQVVHSEAVRRNFYFDKTKLGKSENYLQNITVTSGQIDYEYSWLLKKLAQRNTECFLKNSKISKIETNPIFEIIPGNVENWEKLK